MNYRPRCSCSTSDFLGESAPSLPASQKKKHIIIASQSIYHLFYILSGTNTGGYVFQGGIYWFWDLMPLGQSWWHIVYRLGHSLFHLQNIKSSALQRTVAPWTPLLCVSDGRCMCTINQKQLLSTRNNHSPPPPPASPPSPPPPSSYNLHVNLDICQESNSQAEAANISLPRPQTEPERRWTMIGGLV